MTSIGFDPNTVEKDQQIDIPGVGLATVMRRYVSHNRVVMRVRPHGTPDKRIVVKTFSFNGGGMETSSEEATRVQGNITKYRKALADIGVPVTEWISFYMRTVSDGTTFLIQSEPHAGNTVSELAERYNMDSVCSLEESICQRIIKPLFSNASISGDDENLFVGLDLHLRNITCKFEMDEESEYRPIYVDFFPWKLMTGDDYSLEYPEPEEKTVRDLGIWRHYHKAGLIINFFNSLCLIRPEGAKLYYDLLENFLRSEGFGNVEKSIDGFILDKDLSIGEQSRDDIVKLIERGEWGFKDIFKFRLLACAAALHRPGSRELLVKVHQETHFQDKPLPPGKISAVKNLLLQMFDFDSEKID